jgi:L-threonine kinase
VFPAHKHKAARLATALLAEAVGLAGAPLGGTLVLDSDIPDGKGLASSSADLVATARAVAAVLGLPGHPAAIEDQLRPIEPTDGVMYTGVVAFEHRRVRLRRALGELPALTVVGVDEGGQVDTVAFNHRPKPFAEAERCEYAALLDHCGQSIMDGDLAALGAVATRSAQLNQRLQPKRLLDPVLRICAEVGGLGVVAAHSGTMLGILLADHDSDYPARLATALRACQALPDATATVFHTLTFDPGGSDRAQ